MLLSSSLLLLHFSFYWQVLSVYKPKETEQNLHGPLYITTHFISGSLIVDLCVTADCHHGPPGLDVCSGHRWVRLWKKTSTTSSAYEGWAFIYCIYTHYFLFSFYRFIDKSIYYILYMQKNKMIYVYICFWHLSPDGCFLVSPELGLFRVEGEAVILSFPMFKRVLQVRNLAPLTAKYIISKVNGTEGVVHQDGARVRQRNQQLWFLPANTSDSGEYICTYRWA